MSAAAGRTRQTIAAAGGRRPAAATGGARPTATAAAGSAARTWFADLHVHVGRDSLGRWVKVSSSPGLTLPAILTAASAKGISMVGVVDCASPGVLQDLQRMLLLGELAPARGGGFTWRGGSGPRVAASHPPTREVILIPAVETEVRAGQRTCHIVGYFRDFDSLADYAREYYTRARNPQLSTQFSGWDLARAAASLGQRGALVCVAHAFTPHKGFYGACGSRLTEEVGARSGSPAGGRPGLGVAGVDCVELGLSADTNMADRIEELANVGFLSNSDAHSLAHIGREHNELEAPEPCFDALASALGAPAAGRGGTARLVANYGLDPRLGKYHRTYCTRCSATADTPPPTRVCPRCGSGGAAVVMGVLDRVVEIADRAQPLHPAGRPPYRHQVPLEFIPGVGPRTVQRLLRAFGSEMAVIHQVSESELAAEVGHATARLIAMAREGALDVAAGGGGNYGRLLPRSQKGRVGCPTPVGPVIRPFPPE